MKTTELVKTSPLYFGLGTGLLFITGASLLIPGVLPIAVGALGIGGFATGMLGSVFIKEPKRSEQPKELEASIAEFVVPKAVASLSDGLKNQIIRLQSILKLHSKAGTELTPVIANILRNSHQLFERILSKQDVQSYRLAAVNYTDTLTKLNRALDKDYYLDILKNPNLWNNPAERLAAVDKAVTATGNQLVSNIRQVNASQDIDYAISLESLTSSMDLDSAASMTHVATNIQPLAN